MSDIPAEPSPEIPSFFADKAFAMTRPEAARIRHDGEKLLELSGFLVEATGAPQLAIPVDQRTFIYRYAPAGFYRRNADPSYANVPPTQGLYVPAEGLALPLNQSPTLISRSQIEATTGRQGHQVDILNTQEPFAARLAQTALFPPPEESGILVGLGKWRDHVRREFGSFPNLGVDRSGDKRQRIIAEVTRRFAGAIVLEPRR